MINGLSEWAEQNNMPIEPEDVQTCYQRVLKRHNPVITRQGGLNPATQRAALPTRSVATPPSSDDVPMMYRAQVSGRCSLMYAAESKDRSTWLQEWKHHNSASVDQPPEYQYEIQESYDINPSVYSFTIKFPYRVLTNSGQDSILRPPIGGFGIPYIPGSSIKGLLRRLLHSPDISDADKTAIKTYCGTVDQPGKVRFLGAFPIGDWAANCLDVVHPQQKRQVEADDTTSAYALISFSQPELIMELSSDDPTLPWPEIEALLRQAMRLGLGGKTSTGYGFAEPPRFTEPTHPCYASALHFDLSGKGVTSTLLTGRHEFRPNCFKAALRGHVRRLLAGVCNTPEQVNNIADQFFGSTGAEGSIQLYWDSPNGSYDETYDVEGILHLAARSPGSSDLDFIAKVLEFAYVMAGFGKSWRRVWHHDFFPTYYSSGDGRFPIGCHWQSSKTIIQTSEQLKAFLDQLHSDCQRSYGSTPPVRLTWRETWSPNNVAVFCKQTSTSSEAIKLFHDRRFQGTPAIDGKHVGGQRPEYVSCIWHRMLPIPGNQYLEIVTLFHGGATREHWRRQGSGDQLPDVLNWLTAKCFAQAWGNSVPLTARPVLRRR
ncbi:MAG: hypothetical protein HC851_19665 [Acaryochloris sp. RU_4_1]|nr:hypothetical protein [Acaryochloris sp. SU_5_25]NJM67723.1 hypothetical protein [Acaryochloris sp. RU_4_1]